MAGTAFTKSALCDVAISSYLTDSNETDTPTKSTTRRSYKLSQKLKYGCNPHQVPAAVYESEAKGLPFEVSAVVVIAVTMMDSISVVGGESVAW